MLGYLSNKIVAWNYDVYYLHSSLLTFLIFTLFIFNKIVSFKFSTRHFEILSIAIISCFTLGIALVTIQDNLLYTRWLDFGLFPLDIFIILVTILSLVVYTYNWVQDLRTYHNE